LSRQDRTAWGERQKTCKKKLEAFVGKTPVNDVRFNGGLDASRLYGRRDSRMSSLVSWGSKPPRFRMYWHGVTRGSGRPHTIRLTLLINATTLRVFGERKVAKGLNNYVLTRLQGGANRAEPTVLARRSRSSKWISKIAAAFPEDIKQRNHPASSSDAFPKVRFASMKKGWVLTQELFDTLLGWLDPDRERAGDKYETVRIRLIKVFTCRGCLETL
jgi:hypothetical protein